jgi:hypothetical protein
MTREEQEKEKAAQIIKRAYEYTPEEYHQYIIMISTAVRIGGTRENPSYVYVDRPYMQVDGRVRWAVDEATMGGDKMIVNPAQYFSAESGQLLCSKRVACARGESVGTIEVNVGGGGADRYNAYANAETSALGRALGFLGYGLFGTGIASYEEMESALSRSPEGEKSDIQKLREVATEPVTDAQKWKIRAEAKKLDWAPGEIEAAIEKLGDKRAAIAFIEKMVNGIDPRGNPLHAVSNAERRQFWAQIKEAAGERYSNPVFMDELREEIIKRGWDEKGSTGKLSQDQRDQLITWSRTEPQPESTGFNEPWQPFVKWAKNRGIAEKDLKAYVMGEYCITYPEAQTPADLPRSVPQSYIHAIENEAGEDVLFEEITNTMTVTETL